MTQFLIEFLMNFVCLIGVLAGVGTTALILMLFAASVFMGAVISAIGYGIILVMIVSAIITYMELK